MAARKHHYVPVFYQKGFADANEMLSVYDRKLHTYKELHPLLFVEAKTFIRFGTRTVQVIEG